MTASLLIALASLAGAAGVVLLAVAAHAASGPPLASAGSLLLFHATAVIAATAALRQELFARPVGLAGIGLLLLGPALFAADIALRALAGHRLFPFAAPTGGTLTILGWLVLAAAALAQAQRASRR